MARLLAAGWALGYRAGQIAVAVPGISIFGQAVEHGWLQIGDQPHLVGLIHLYFPCTDVLDGRNAAVGLGPAGIVRVVVGSVIWSADCSTSLSLRRARYSRTVKAR